MKKEKKKEKSKLPEEKNVKLTEDALEKVSSGIDPFADIKRIPEKDIDEALRNNG